MGWFNGYIGKFDFKITKDEEEIDNYYYSWIEKGRKLESFIQLEPVEITLDSGVKILSGTVYFEYLKRTKNIVKSGKVLKVIDDKEVIDTLWSRFWLTKESYIVIKVGRFKRKIFEVLCHGLDQEPNSIRPITFNIEEIAYANPRKWLGGFYDREGNVSSGVFFGENIENDIELGDIYKDMKKKNQVVFFTEYFRADTKIKITRTGYIQIFTNLEDRPNLVFEYIRDELEPYILDSL